MKTIDRMPEIGEFVYYQEIDNTFTLCEVVPQPKTNGMINAPSSSGIIFLKNPKDHPNVTHANIAYFKNPVRKWNSKLFFPINEEKDQLINLYTTKEND